LDVFSLFPFRRRDRRAGRPVSARPALEPLEDRQLLSGNVISGFVYHDANDNGLREPGEQPIANSTIQLLNSSRTVIGVTATDANGYYQFNADSTISTAPTTQTQTLTIPPTRTRWDQTLAAAQFDPDKGTLTGVDILTTGSVTSDIKVENTSSSSPSAIDATVSGKLTLSGPGFALAINPQANAGTFSASTFDGALDYAGASGHDFGAQTATGSDQRQLSAPADLAQYVGKGNVTLSVSARSTSSINGSGNETSQITTDAGVQVTVVYHYIPSNRLRPGDYTLVQPTEPAGYLDGLDSRNGTVLPNSTTTDFIPVTLTNSDLPNNNFGEVLPASVSGTVYFDQNNNGIQDPGEPGIGGVVVKLDGPADNQQIHMALLTGPDGSYSFPNLRPGNYTVSEFTPAGYFNGLDRVGSAGGALGSDMVSNIALASGLDGVHYDFGELLPASVSGTVYLDQNNNGVRDPGEPGLSGVVVKLDGAMDTGPVHMALLTGADGTYSFPNLRPGTFTISEFTPAGYLDGQDSVGSAGGVLGNDAISGVALPAGVNGVNYNFGELLPPPPTPVVNPVPPVQTPPTAVVYADYFALNPSTFARPEDLPILGKAGFLTIPGQAGLDPNTLADVIFVDGVYRSLLGRPLDLAGLTNLVPALRAGTPRDQIVHAIWNTPEHLGLEVDRLFETFLHRDPDPVSRANFVNWRMGGATSLDLTRTILNSQEFQAAHADNDSFLTALYAQILGRLPDTTGLNTWRANLQGGMARDTVIAAFLYSGEAYLKFIDRAYVTFLHRAADEPGRQAVLAWAQTNHLDLQAIGEALLASGEYFSQAQAAAAS
jgi:hypothetical protein